MMEHRTLLLHIHTIVCYTNRHTIYTSGFGDDFCPTLCHIRLQSDDMWVVCLAVPYETRAAAAAPSGVIPKHASS